MKPNTGRLKITLPSDREILVTRKFAAPRQLVYDAHTKPEMIKRWLFGPDGWSLPVCEIDLRVGGKFRYVWHHVDGRKMGMSGVFREIASPERLVSSEIFDDAWYAGEAVNIMVLTERSGITLLTLTIRYVSKEARDAVLRIGMYEGMELGYTRLDKIFRPRSKPSAATKGKRS